MSAAWKTFHKGGGVSRITIKIRRAYKREIPPELLVSMFSTSSSSNSIDSVTPAESINVVASVAEPGSGMTLIGGRHRQGSWSPQSLEEVTLSRHMALRASATGRKLAGHRQAHCTAARLTGRVGVL